jgi:hypothetical protein
MWIGVLRILYSWSIWRTFNFKLKFSEVLGECLMLFSNVSEMFGQIVCFFSNVSELFWLFRYLDGWTEMLDCGKAGV